MWGCEVEGGWGERQGRERGRGVRKAVSSRVDGERDSEACEGVELVERGARWVMGRRRGRGV